MTDPRTLVERELERVELPAFTLDGFHHRRDRKRRNERITAGVVAVAVALAGIAFSIGALDTSDTKQPLGPASNGDVAVRSEGQLLAMAPDGSNVHVLVADPFVGDGCDEAIGCHIGDRYAWSPVGDRLAFEAGITTTDVSHWAIYVAEPDGSDPRLVVTCPSRPEPDGLLRRELVRRDSDGACEDLAWSPDGTRLAFATAGDLSVVDVASGVVTVVTECGDRGCSPGVYAAQPDWSPDGARLAFGTPTGGYAIVTLDGSRAPLVVPPSAEGGGGSGPPATYPTWSPDGTVILARGYPSTGVVAINPDTGDEVVLADPKSRAWIGRPAWTPDGRTIVFSGEVRRGGMWHTAATIWTADADGSHDRAVYDCDWCAMPSFAVSPDGTTIVFSVDIARGREGEDGVYVMRLDGSGLNRIGTAGELPIWQPLPREG